MRLNEEGLHENNEEEDKGENAFDQGINLWSQNIGIGW